MTNQLFPFPGADGRQSAFVRSTTSGEQAQVPDLFLYTQQSFRFKPVQQNPTGSFGNRVSAFTATGYTAVAMVYRKSAGSAAVALATTGVMTWNGSGYFQGVLDLNTVEAAAAAASAAAGAAVEVRFLFLLIDGSGQPFACEQATRLFYALPADDLPAATSVTTTIFADLLDVALVDTDTVFHRRSGNTVLADVPLFGAPALFADVTVAYSRDSGTGAATPTSLEDSVTVGGVDGERYLCRARITGTAETNNYDDDSLDKPGDPPFIRRAGSDASGGSNDVWYLDISSPAQRIWLNQVEFEPQEGEALDYYFQFLADAGATLTLGFDTGGTSSVAGTMTLHQVGATEVAPSNTPGSREALSFSSAGNTAVTPTSGRHVAVITAAQGAGSYTRTLAVATTNRVAGDLALLRVAMPASANPVVEVRNATSGGTLLATLTGSTVGSDALVVLGYSGSAWELLGLTADDLLALLANPFLGNIATVGPSVTANTLFQGTGANSLQFTAFSANTFPARGSSGSLEAKTVTDQALALLDDTTAAAQRATIGVEGRSVRLTASTTDATQTEMLTSSSGRAVLPANSGWTFAGRLVARFGGSEAWTARDSSRDWSNVASSSDGTKLVACVFGGQIYTSTDSGATWTARDSSRAWQCVASSSDGTKLVAGTHSGQIYTSTDSGATWTARDSSRIWLGVASSSDGSKLVAGTAGGQIYTSTDSGATWTARDSNRDWWAVASSSDGTKLVACASGDHIYTSTDSGATWTARDSVRSWYVVASSADGTKLVAGVTGGQIYTSTDSGATWTARDSSRNWHGVASSSDGTKLVATAQLGQVYTSIDSGVTWTARASSREWRGVASSADGGLLVAVVYGGHIYTASNAASETQAIHFAGKASRDTAASSVSVSDSSEIQWNPIGSFTWGLAIDADTSNGAVRARVTGETGKPINWALTVDFTEVTN